jgi:hypothetical protein
VTLRYGGSMVVSTAVVARGTTPELVAAAERTLRNLAQSVAPASILQMQFFEIAARLLATERGLFALYERSHRFDESGVFAGGPWEDAAALQVPLVAGTLRGSGVTPIVESLSELRLLAIATGRAHSEAMTAEEATQFLEEVLATNLRYLLPSQGETEEERSVEDRHRESHERLFALVSNEIGSDRVIEEVVLEVDQVLAQRPISVRSVRRMIERGWAMAVAHDLQGPPVDALERYVSALSGPTALSRSYEVPRYRARIRNADVPTLKAEADGLAESMRRTGLVSAYQAVLVRHLAQQRSPLLGTALGVGERGRVEIEHNLELLCSLIDAAVGPTTAQCIYGLGAMLDRTLLSRIEVAAGLERLLGIDLQPDVEENLLASRDDDDPISAQGVLVAGTMAVLGQPLGIGQGRNPTCQSARGLSLWAQHDPAHLLALIVAAARDGWVEMRYTGRLVRSDHVTAGVAETLDLDLDPVSIVLVPHLDRLYAEFMRRSALYLEDAHKWVNPALYGWWVHNEIATVFADVAQTTVSDPETFVRRFFATHHPDYDGGHRLMYPNPVGLVITNHRGVYLGPHAVSIQRVDRDRDDEVRVYFYNPNNEGRQDWGQGVVVSVHGHGEIPGESSLPLWQFASRLYAFHYNPNEQGPLEDVDDNIVRSVVEAMASTWGRRFNWLAA